MTYNNKSTSPSKGNIQREREGVAERETDNKGYRQHRKHRDHSEIIERSQRDYSDFRDRRELIETLYRDH